MRPHDRAENIVSRLDARHPVAHRFVDRIPQRPRAAAHGSHFRAQQLHAEHVGGLATNIFLAHVDDAVEAEMGTGRRRGDAMLTGPRLGDHAFLAHPQSEQRLAERVVDLMGTGVIQVFALEPDLGPAAMLGESLGKVQRRRAAHIVFQQVVELGLKMRISLRGVVFLDQLIEREDQCLRHVPAPEIAVATELVGDSAFRTAKPYRGHSKVTSRGTFDFRWPAARVKGKREM